MTVRVPDHPVGTEEADHVEDQGHDQHGDAHLQNAVRFSHVPPASSRQLADEDGAAVEVVAAAFYVVVVVHRYSPFSFVSALYRQIEVTGIGILKGCEVRKKAQGSL